MNEPEMDDFNDNEIDHVLDAMSEQVAHNSQRLDQLLERLQDRLARDYTNVPIAIGALMVMGGFLHIFFKDEFIFSLTAMVCGSLILSLTFFFRYRITGHLTKFGESLIKLDQDRQGHARKLAVIEKLIQEGIPSTMSLNHLLILLGEYKETQIDGDGLDTRPENN